MTAPLETSAARPLAGPSVWLANDFPRQRSWVRDLTTTMVDELKQVTARAIRNADRFDTVSRGDYPLRACAPLLASVYADLEDGSGFAVIGGFPVAEFDYDEALVAYALLSAQIGVLVDQSYAGDMKIDVLDTGVAYSKDARGYLTNDALRFHSDGAALTGLCCLSAAAEGGASVLASAGAVSNAVLEQRPDLHALLVEGFHHHRRGQHVPGARRISEKPIPVFAFREGLMHCSYDRNQSLWTAEEGVIFTAEQIEAMDFLDSVLEDPRHQLHMDLHAGDIQLVNNFTVLHSRTAYVDDCHTHRHLVRFWLENPAGKRRGFTMRELYVRDAGIPA